MAVVRSDCIAPPTGLHDRRVLAWLRSRGGDALADHAVWCAAALPGGHAAARGLRALVGDKVEVRPLDVEATEPPAASARQLDAVRPGDVVVLHDNFTVPFAAALRDRGAHAIWHLRRPPGSRAPWVREAFDVLDRRGAGAVDAVVLDERIGSEGPARVSALIPAARLLDTREVPPGRDAGRLALAWTSLLGDILEEDRTDHVGGTIQARPVVAAR